VGPAFRQSGEDRRAVRRRPKAVYRNKPEGGPRVQAKRGGPEGSKKAAEGGVPK